MAAMCCARRTSMRGRGIACPQVGAGAAQVCWINGNTSRWRRALNGANLTTQRGARGLLKWPRHERYREMYAAS